ncbi:MAG: helix-turn-helix transcriptional regulator, partial [Mesorhizobium sp.]
MTMMDRYSDAVAGDRYITSGAKYNADAQVTRPSYAYPSTRASDETGGDEPKRRSLESVTGMLDRLGCGYLVLNRDRKVIEWNAAALTTLERPTPEHPTLEHKGEAADTASELSAALRRLVANVPAPFLPGSLSWVVIRSTGDRPVVLKENGLIAPDGTSIVALLGRVNRSGPNPQTLQRMFGLTS